MEGMISNSNLTVSAWESNNLVGEGLHNLAYKRALFQRIGIIFEIS
ncbi:hypothetical protein [uncultured Gammaproteobacteria bacterium]|nr:hypothetical protein [uncultured Gammaproteobacteria bacterium]CAC9961385.1 hypothetical protein [uncultured Gammaproteobacteria bacterium]